MTIKDLIGFALLYLMLSGALGILTAFALAKLKIFKDPYSTPAKNWVKLICFLSPIALPLLVVPYCIGEIFYLIYKDSL